jgi:YgiT-type zinc finger domain-containing protein
MGTLANLNISDDKGAGLPALCPECATGVMRLKHITYFTWLNEELITVPNFPAWVCDICGLREFDPRAVTWLNALLNPAAGRSQTSAQRSKNRPPVGTESTQP